MNKNKFSYLDFYILSLLLIVFGLLISPNFNVLKGMKDISLSPSILLSDYMKIGGLGPAFFNSGAVLLFTVIFSNIYKSRLTGVLVAGLFTIVGFGFFGKNLINSIPLILGVYLYTRVQGLEISNLMHVACFSTGISPAVSLIMFGLGLPLYLSIPLSILAGVFIGFIITPLSSSMLNFHKGYNLYNVGFTLGIIGLGLAGILRMFNHKIENPKLLYLGDDRLVFYFILFLSLFMFLYGLYLNKGFRGYKKILASSGRLVSDFVIENSKGLVLINMGLLGLVSILFVKFSNGIINGPILGGIFTVIGFGAFGKHPKNVLPIFLGVYIASILNIYDPAGTEAILISLFASTIAPVAGKFGIIAGVVAGFLHKSIATNVGIIHGGMNLYNNGLAGGFVAGILVPLYELIEERRQNNA